MPHDRDDLPPLVQQSCGNPPRKSNPHTCHAVADNAAIGAVGGVVPGDPHLVRTDIAAQQRSVLEDVPQLQECSRYSKGLSLLQAVAFDMIKDPFSVG